jgi:hypothetical protein
MITSNEWIAYFQKNLQARRINWNQLPRLTVAESATILSSLQAWQLGETSDGSHLLKATSRHAKKTGDAGYILAMELFIKEEQKHGNNLGRYLDLLGQPRIKKDWGDTLFRKIRYFNTSMELWTLAVITVESAAQLFYQSLKEATECTLLQEICTDILIDEEKHILFQMNRLRTLFQNKKSVTRVPAYYGYRCFFFSTALVVWLAHRKVFRAGGNDFTQYQRNMRHKFHETIGTLKSGNSQSPVAIIDGR